MVKAMIGFYIMVMLYSIFGTAYSIATGHFELVTLNLFVGLIGAGLLALVNMEQKRMKTTN
ncbi:MAG: hypothetical protein ACO1OT_06980 [Heyndrickxia sp.]